MAVARISKIFRENSVEKRAKADWKHVFDQYDKNKDGYITVNELDELIENQEHGQALPLHVIQRIHSIGDENKDGVLDFNEFIKLIQFSDLRPLFGNLVNRYISIVVPKNALEERRDYHDKAKYCPPPLGMITISLIEIILYFTDAAMRKPNERRGPIADALIYDPERRYQAWRFLTYMFVHDGLFHLGVNLIVQLFLGIILEIVNRWWRVLIIYFAGVVAGSLGASIVDPESILQGASGGVYAVITAHIASIILNWRQMDYQLAQLIIFMVLVCCDIGNAIYERHVQNIFGRVSYVAHLAGALAGLLMGINVVQNVKVTRKETIIWWISVVTYIVLMGVGIVWHIAGTNYFPTQV